MEPSTRIVRRVRMRGADEGRIRRGVRLLEDALRTASLPDAGGRVVLVRRLALGRFDPRAPPQTLALALGREVAQRRSGIAYADGDLPGSGAVWFRDALDAHTRLALRLADGRSVDAWYWPLAVRAWQRGSSIPAALRSIALSLAAFPEAPSALPRWAAALCAAGHGGRLVAALRTVDVAVLARAAALPAGEIAAAPETPSPDAPDDGSSRAQGLREIAASRVDAAGAPARRDDPRRALLRALLRIAGSRLTDVAKLDEGVPGFAPAGPARRQRTRPEQSTVRSRREPARGALAPDRLDPREVATRHERTLATGRASSGADEGGAPEGAATSAGGLLFLLPALVRIGFADWLAAHPQWARFELARRVLAQALTRLDVAAEDPAWLLAAHRVHARAVPCRFTAPPVWRGGLNVGTGPLRIGRDGSSHALWDRSGRLLLGAWRGACPRPLLEFRRGAEATGPQPPADLIEAVTGAWLVASRRWLRRGAGIGLAALVGRPATLSLTPTHADLRFELAHTDLRVRRVGLDLDPGWVPWLGRVVTFHYDR